MEIEQGMASWRLNRTPGFPIVKLYIGTFASMSLDICHGWLFLPSRALNKIVFFNRLILFVIPANLQLAPTMIIVANI